MLYKLWCKLRAIFDPEKLKPRKQIVDEQTINLINLRAIANRDRTRLDNYIDRLDNMIDNNFTQQVTEEVIIEILTVSSEGVRQNNNEAALRLLEVYKIRGLDGQSAKTFIKLSNTYLVKTPNGANAGVTKDTIEIEADVVIDNEKER